MCFEFDRKHSKQIRREITSIQVEIGHTLVEKANGPREVKLFARSLHAVGGFFKSATFQLPGGEQIHILEEERCVVECTVPAFEGEFTVTLHCRKENFPYTHTVAPTPGCEKHDLILPPVKKKQKRMHDMFPGLEDSTAHGSLVNNAQEKWLSPICVVECEKEARPGYNTKPSHEYEDDPRTLLLKVRELKRLLNQCKKSCAYTGAGLSTSSGIDDYASRATGKKSHLHINRAQKKQSAKDALPALGHRVLVELWRKGKLHSWVQQNHDGLPQKAGFPQEQINEIHGGWFDPSNPVVPMSGSLRSDLCEWHTKLEETCDLTIAIGTSMCGMTADSVFTDVCERYNDDGEGLGGVIIGLQQTQYDDISSLRIFARIDVVLSLLAREMKMQIPRLQPYRNSIPEDRIVAQHIFKVPYDKNGHLTSNKDEMICWNLNPGQKIRVVQGPGKGFIGTIAHLNSDGHYKLHLPIQRQGAKDFGMGKRTYTLGLWWAQTAVFGKWPKLPVVNVKPQLQKDL